MASTSNITSSHPFFRLVGNAKSLRDSTEQLRTNVFSQSGVNEQKVLEFGDIHSQAVQFGGEISTDLTKMLRHLGAIIKLKGDESPSQFEESVHAVQQVWDGVVGKINNHNIGGVDDVKSLIFKDGYQGLLQQQTERVGHFMKAAKKIITTVTNPVKEVTGQEPSARFQMSTIKAVHPIKAVPLLCALIGAGAATVGGTYVNNTDCKSGDESIACEVKSIAGELKSNVGELLHAITHPHNES